MGIATLMIIACHAPASGVQLPGVVAQLFTFGNFGVDLFLLLSGLGVYYSLRKKPVNTLLGGARFYKRRTTRIFIPYLLIYIPFCIICFCLEKYSLGDCLLSLSTLEFWIYHRGAWFISLIMVLYLLSPVLFSLFETKWKWWIVAGFLVAIMIVCNLYSSSETGFCSNMLSALGRVPSFILGMAIGKDCIEERSLSALWLFPLLLLYVVCRKYLFITDGVAWLLIPVLVYAFLFIVNIAKRWLWFDNSLKFLGKVSLESYLTNITINSVLVALIPAYISSPVFHGRWLEYVIVIVLGLICAYYVNRFSQKIQKTI